MTVLERLLNSARLLRRSRLHYYRNAMLKPPYWLSANGQLCRVAALSEAGAASCYTEVAVEDCYGLFSYARRARPQVIVDIGANFGIFSKLCTMLFPDADIYAYEPNPVPVPCLLENVAGTRVRVQQVAVGEKSGVVMLDTNCDTTNSQVKDDGDLPVRCLGAAEVADGRAIDLLKMDCEGSEWNILREPSLLKRTQEFRLAYHLFDGHTVEDIRVLAERSGHRIVRHQHTEKGEKYGLISSVRQAAASHI